MARSNSGGPNTSNFSDPRFDELFLRMKSMENGPERLAIIHEMRAILEEESPWVPLFHPEEYALYHGWLDGLKPAGLSFPTTKYRDIDPELRREQLARLHRRRGRRERVLVTELAAKGVEALGVVGRRALALLSGVA